MHILHILPTSGSRFLHHYGLLSGRGYQKHAENRPAPGARPHGRLDAWPHRMRISIERGTPTNCQDSLCDTCRNARIIRGRRLDDEIVLCELRMASTRIPFKVTTCSHYDDRRHPHFFEYMERAWILRRGRRGRPAGFVRASELEELEHARIMRRLRNQENRE
jgi:hypothetical protein